MPTEDLGDNDYLVEDPDGALIIQHLNEDGQVVRVQSLAFDGLSEWCDWWMRNLDRAGLTVAGTTTDELRRQFEEIKRQLRGG